MMLAGLQDKIFALQGELFNNYIEYLINFFTFIRSKMAIVTLINLFSLPQEIEVEFSQSWHKTAEKMKQQLGFIDSNLHRNLNEDGNF
jgi:hypothetical protein